MKCHLGFLALLFFALSGYTQTIDTLKKQPDTTAGDTVANKPLLSKAVTYDKTAKPNFQHDSIMLKKAGNQESTSQEKKVMPMARNASASASLISTSIDAGRTTGALDVSPTGGSTYTIPISLPPGLGKNMPQLALVYSSQAGKGIAGLGWNISGLSSITRISTSMFHDGRIDGINLNENDRFALDGQRLILKSGTYGIDGAEYQTENYSNIKVISHGSVSVGSSSGPQYFEVFYPDGSKAIYGNDSNSRNLVQWAINYSENPLGARISYDYILSNNSIIHR